MSVFNASIISSPALGLQRYRYEHKDWKTFPGGHFVPENELIRETLDWYDKHLGEPE